MSGQCSLSYINYVAGINLGYASYAGRFLSEGAWACSARYVDYGKFDGYDPDGNSTGKFTAKDIVIDSEKKDIVTCLDGECITTDHVHIRLADQKLNFFGPDGCSCNATARETAPTGE